MNSQMQELYTQLITVSESLDDQYRRLKIDLDSWRSKIIQITENIFSRMLLDLDTSYERLETFQETLEILLNEEQLIDETATIGPTEMVKKSAQLSWIEQEMNDLSQLSFRFDDGHVAIDIRPSLISLKSSDPIQLNATPCRILLKREQIQRLSDTVNKSDYTLLTHVSSPEVILTIMNFHQLAILIEEILSVSNEIRVLIQESYVPIIIGQLGNRAQMLKEKYALTNIKIFPTCAPASTERILLLSATKNEAILQCLTEIYCYLFSNSSNDHNEQAIFLYSPEFYDGSLVEDYGGFFDGKLTLLSPVSEKLNPNDEDELNEFEDEDVEDFDQDVTNYLHDTVESLRERHWTLSDAQAGALFGPNCSRLHQIRSESNAWIVIYEAEGKNARRPMSIRGTKSEIEHATRLILDTIKRHDRKMPLKYNQKRGR